MIAMANIKREVAYHVLALLFVDYVILLNLPVIRQFFSTLYFTIVPGAIILQVLKIKKVDTLKKISLSIGLSVSFLMFYGLFINIIYPNFGVSKPLSTVPLLFSINLVLFLLLLLMYRINKDLDESSSLSSKSYDRFKYISLTIFPILLPFLSIFGNYLMNTRNNNIILIIMLLLIPIYIFLLVFLRNKTLEITHPIAIYTVALSLLFMHGLTSNYLNGRDIHMEYYAARVVSSNLYWSMANFHKEVTACLSTSLLPVVYWSLSGIDILYVYKIVYQMIWATTPLVCYLLFKNYVNKTYALLASFFFIFQMPFIFDLQSAMRTEISLFFIALIWFVHFDNDIDEVNKKILFLVFMFSSIFSHYSAAYLFFFHICILWMSIKLIKYAFDMKVNHSISGIVVLLSCLVLFFWYAEITDTTFTILIRFMKQIFLSINDFFATDVRAQGSYVPNTNTLTLPSYTITFVVTWITFSFIAVGVFDSIISYIIVHYKQNKKNFNFFWNRPNSSLFSTSDECSHPRVSKIIKSPQNNKKTNLEIEYNLIGLIFGITLLAFLLLPYASAGYGNTRLYQQLLTILAIYFVIGGKVVSKYIFRQKDGMIIVLFILISQFFCASLVIHQAFGIHVSEDLNRDGTMYNEYYIHDSEVASSRWLSNYNSNSSVINTDFSGFYRLLMGCKVGEIPKVNEKFFTINEETNNGYIYLRYYNVIDNYVLVGNYFEGGDNLIGYTSIGLSNRSHLFSKKNLLYNNNGSRIYG